MSTLMQASHQWSSRPDDERFTSLTETLWDAATAVTAYARGVGYQDERIELEREGGRILDLAN
jgi:hypothetical protein